MSRRAIDLELPIVLIYFLGKYDTYYREKQNYMKNEEKINFLYKSANKNQLMFYFLSIWKNLI